MQTVQSTVADEGRQRKLVKYVCKDPRTTPTTLVTDLVKSVIVAPLEPSAGMVC